MEFKFKKGDKVRLIAVYDIDEKLDTDDLERKEIKAISERTIFTIDAFDDEDDYSPYRLKYANGKEFGWYGNLDLELAKINWRRRFENVKSI